MPEYYVKYKWPKDAIGMDIGYDIREDSLKKSKKVELFLTYRGIVMVFQSKKHAEVQIIHKKEKDSEFKRWASDIRIVKGEDV